MGCGCSGNQEVRRDNPMIVSDIHEIKARKMMCLTCKHFNEEKNKCAITDLSLANLTISKDPKCPLDRHDKNPKWLGIKWMGVPKPIRWYIYLFHEHHPKPSFFPGCGCILILKNLYLKCKNRIYSLGRFLVNKRVR